MPDDPRYLVIRTDDIEPFTHPEDPAYHSQHVLGQETTGRHDLLLNQGTVDPHKGLGGGNHPDNDEIYYIVSGETLVDLGGDPVSGDGHETYRLVPLDMTTVMASVAATGWLFTVEENPRLCGWGAEVASIVAEEGIDHLSGPIVRITTPHQPLPAAENLERLAIPTPERVADTILRALR